MKNTIKRLSLLFLAIASIMFFMSCGEPGDGGTTPVAITFESAEQTGGSNGYISTGLTLTFSDDPTTLTVDNITLTGATKGELSGSGTTRTLGISNITVENGGNVNITINNPSGYTISGSPKTAIVYNVVYNLRDTGPAGGLIFYVNPNASTDGWKYLEAAPKDTEKTGILWGKKGTLVNGTDTAIGTGQANTDLILAVLNPDPQENDRAAQVASDVDAGGKSDWFLPSIDELEQMKLILYDNGNFGEFDLTYPFNYWSSSEVDANDAKYLSFGSGNTISGSKDVDIRVRAVRSF